LCKSANAPGEIPTEWPTSILQNYVNALAITIKIVVDWCRDIIRTLCSSACSPQCITFAVQIILVLGILCLIFSNTFSYNWLCAVFLLPWLFYVCLDRNGKHDTKSLHADVAPVMMQIFVIMPWKEAVCITLPLLDASASTVKRLINEQFGISPANQGLSLGRKKLKPEHMLRENSVLQLYVHSLKAAELEANKALAERAKTKNMKRTQRMRTAEADDDKSPNKHPQNPDEAAAAEEVSKVEEIARQASVMRKRRQHITGLRIISRSFSKVLVFTRDFMLSCVHAAVSLYCGSSKVAPNMLQIFVNMPWSQTMSIQLPSLNVSTGIVESLIHERFGISPENQGLIFGGKRLKSDQELREYGIQNNSTIHLFVHGLKGGALPFLELAVIIENEKLI